MFSFLFFCTSHHHTSVLLFSCLFIDQRAISFYPAKHSLSLLGFSHCWWRITAVLQDLWNPSKMLKWLIDTSERKATYDRREAYRKMTTWQTLVELSLDVYILGLTMIGLAFHYGIGAG